MTEGKRKNSIYIDGEKLRKHIEAVTGKTIYEVAESAGFSKKFLFEACKKGVASPTVQAVLKVLGIDVFKFEVFKAKEPEPGDYKQISFDDLEEERKRLFKERLQFENERQEFIRIKSAFALEVAAAHKKENAIKAALTIIEEYNDKMYEWLTEYEGAFFHKEG